MNEIATLGGGCFWCLEAVFEPLAGVAGVVSGFAGGHDPDASHADVCSGTTGHAEVIQVTFDPAVLPYRALLELFFAFHDPTTRDRQGPDVGTQYRSVIFTHTPAQAATARQLIAELDKAGVWDAPIVTEVAPFETFIAAEGYHQGYFRNNPRQPYCQAMIAPKVAKLRQKYAARLKPGAAI
jgi:peptide-methionine (S)-S-oxide reductase